jgi:hypothetical protein
MNDNSTHRTIDRTIRIERLRLLAAIDRDSLSNSAYHLIDECRPSTIVGHWLSNTSLLAQPTHFLNHGANLLSEYPYLAASLSSLLLGRKSRLLRIAGLLLGSVSAWRAVLRATTRDQSQR